MKKFFVISVAALFCLGMTLPAMAKVKVGGMITQDVYYYHQDANAAQGGVETYPSSTATTQGSFSAFEMNLPQALNRLNVAYSNDDNSIRGFIEIRGVTDSIAITWTRSWSRQAHSTGTMHGSTGS
jgi:hypothetical protein